MTSEITENFSIAAAIHSRQSNYSNKSKDKRCEHCNRDGHTIENCRTLKFHCKHCGRRGHTEERCKFKNGTWTSNSSETQANATESSQIVNGDNSQSSNLNNSTHGFSPDQLQQLARALSMMSTNNNGNNSAYANAAAEPSHQPTSEPLAAAPNTIHHDTPSTDNTLDSDNAPNSENSTIVLDSDTSISNPTNPITPSAPSLHHSTRSKQAPIWHKDYILSTQVNRSVPTSSSASDTKEAYMVKRKSNFLRERFKMFDEFS
ncbi:hypothetical protein LWI29_020799 [Acer saccharum]|uniref:CCHC-type domain-containing protein n=1 Tax=Acer saccharum TaxID=4024 RepID=A0AA39STF7_ACESA|nr:hypothetical protein LWI29_020799 [Acer saccharum]